MLVHMGAKYRAYPAGAQASLAGRWFGCCRAAHNVALDQRRMFSRKGRRIGYSTQTAELPALKREFPWLGECYSQCLQQALKDLDDAYDRFHKGLGGYPKPWKKFEDDSLRFPQIQQVDKDTGTVTEFVRFGPDGIHLPGGFGFLRVTLHRPLPGKPKSVTLSRKGSGEHAEWTVSVLCEVEIADPVQVKRGGFDYDVLLKGFTGIDFGAAKPKDNEPNNAYVDADGTFHAVPGETPGEAARRRTLERAIARRVLARKRRETEARAAGTLKANERLPVSKRELLARDALRALDARVRRRRHDALHKITTFLAKNHGLVGVEDLPIQGMTASARGTRDEPGRNVAQKAGLNRGILGNAFGTFKRLLRYKAGWYGCAVVFVPPAYTSQTCSECQRHPKDLLGLAPAERAALPEHERTLVERWTTERAAAKAAGLDWSVPNGRVSRSVFECPLCGFACHADVNAARTIQRLALAEFCRKVDSGAWADEELERRSVADRASKRRLTGKKKKTAAEAPPSLVSDVLAGGHPVSARGAFGAGQAENREVQPRFH